MPAGFPSFLPSFGFPAVPSTSLPHTMWSVCWTKFQVSHNTAGFIYINLKLHHHHHNIYTVLCGG